MLSWRDKENSKFTHQHKQKYGFILHVTGYVLLIYVLLCVKQLLISTLTLTILEFYLLCIKCAWNKDNMYCTVQNFQSSKTKNIQKMTEMGRYLDVSVQPPRKVSDNIVRLFIWNHHRHSCSEKCVCFVFVFFNSNARRRWWPRINFLMERCEWSEWTVSAPQIHPMTLQ